MKPVDQTIIGKGNPRGNCLQAALASIMEYPLRNTIDVTHPDLDPEQWHVALSKWGNLEGWNIYTQREQPRTDEYYIAVGPTTRMNGQHACVYQSGKLVHDPHPDRSGLKRVRYCIRVIKQVPRWTK